MSSVGVKGDLSSVLDDVLTQPGVAGMRADYRRYSWQRQWLQWRGGKLMVVAE